MKKNILLLVLFFIGFSLQAQRKSYNQSSSGSSFEQGNVVISAGYGFGNLAQTVLNFALDAFDTQDLNKSITGPLFFKGEYAVSDKIGLGLNIASVTNKASFKFTETVNNQPQTFYADIKRPNTSILAHANYHFVTSEKVDVYVGTGIGVRFGTFKFTSDYQDFANKISIPSGFPVGFELTVGARYFPIENLGLYSEFGGAKGIVQFGVCGKF